MRSHRCDRVHNPGFGVIRSECAPNGTQRPERPKSELRRTQYEKYGISKSFRRSPPPYPPPTKPRLAGVSHYTTQVGQARLASGEGRVGASVGCKGIKIRFARAWAGS